jgi:DNA-binding LacI/PurR family transcriptional regulator
MSITVRSLAAQAGVSPAAISCALNGTGNLSAATRARLRSLARAAGYVPRPALAALSAMRARGVLPPTLPVAVLGAVRIDAPLRLAGAELGYRLIPCPLDGGDELSRLHRRLVLSGTVAVILVGGPGYAACLAHDWTGLAVLAHGWQTPDCAYHHLGGRIFAGLALAWQRVAAHGYRRIGAAILAHEPLLPDDSERLGACLAAQSAGTGAAVPPCVARHGDERGVLAWWRVYRPDAVIGFHAGLLAALRRHGADPPFASLHLDDGDHRQRDLAGLVVSPTAYARVAMRMVDDCVRHHDLGRPASPRSIALPPQWRGGASLPQRPAHVTSRAAKIPARLRSGAEGGS